MSTDILYDPIKVPEVFYSHPENKKQFVVSNIPIKRRRSETPTTERVFEKFFY